MHIPKHAFLLLIVPALFGAAPLAAQFDVPVVAFQSEVDYPYKLNLGDLDGDGDLDILMAQSQGAFGFLNDGTGVFGPKLLLPTQSIYTYSLLEVADVNMDGTPDLMAGTMWYPGLGGATFGPGVSTGAGGWDLVADVDGDGDPDVVARNNTQIQLRINDGAGNFALGQIIGTAGANLTSVYARFKDVNGDLLPDLVIGGGCLQRGWYANLGGGAFGPVNDVPELVGSEMTHCGDVDGDGDNDILTDNDVGTIWLANDGSGTFTVADTLSTIFTSTAAEVAADVDGDGDLDLAVSTGTSCNVHWWWNTGDGYAWSNTVVEDLTAYSLQGTKYAVGDVDGDGDMDLLAANGQGIMGWYPNEGGSWGERQRACAYLGGANDLSVADIDQDGDPDMVVSAYYGKHVTWYANNGDGTFGGQQVVLDHLTGNFQAHVMDLDGNGWPDILTDNAEAALIWNNGGGISWTVQSLPGLGTSRYEADLDGDLDPDLVGTGAWYENDGSGGFTDHAEPLLTAGQVKVADMDGDGIVDIVIGSATGWSVLVNDGAMGLTPLTGADYMGLYDLGDVDGDGDLDAYTLAPINKVYRLLNDGTGQLSSTLVADLGSAGNPRHMLVTDINGDGYADAVWAMSQGYTHNTYYNLNVGNGDLGPIGAVLLGNGSASDLVLADLNADVVPDLVSASHHYLSWQENHFYDAFRLRGTLFLDFDLDVHLDATDHRVPFKLVRTDANNVLVWTNSIGEFDLPADTGTWHAWHTPAPSYQVTNDPDTLEATLTTMDPIATGMDIGLAPATNDTLPEFWITAPNMRCNTEQSVHLRLANNGTVSPLDVIVSFEILGDLTLVQAMPPPDSIVGQFLYWHVDSLGWFQEFTAWINVQVGEAGTMAGALATMTSGNLPDTLIAGFGPWQVGCAVDPNDKLVTPQGYGAAGAVDIDTPWLDYTVRFQNTGNDTAFTVTVLDTLDTDLDPVTMEVLAASHALTRIQVDTDRVALFRFERILLPDSGVNETASHGFVRFRIRPIAGSPDGTVITNGAGIVFDWNAPVLTNSVTNTLVDCDLYQPVVISVGGNDLEATGGDAYQWFLDGASIPGANGQQYTALVSGNYTAQVTSSLGCVALTDPYQLIITGVAQQGEEGLVLHPNPVQDLLTVTALRGAGQGARVVILDVHGRRCKDLPVGQHLTGGKLRVDVKTLAAGAYVLQLIDADGVRAVRFTKD
ncbi:MAG: FG-GAP-like repeat-containing protein [Flavobacteriales bacterium]